MSFCVGCSATLKPSPFLARGERELGGSGRVSRVHEASLTGRRASMAQRNRHGLKVSAKYGGGKQPEEDPTSKAILDAFFLGRALAEILNERLGRAVGEFISEVSQRQAEQKEQTRQFQEEVKERAQAALLKAAKEALAAQGSASEPPLRPSSPPATPPVSTSDPPTSV